MSRLSVSSPGLTFGFALLMLGGCATSANKLPTQYVSPIQYQHYDCDQIRAEMARVTRRVGTLKGEIDSNATGDAVATGIGVVLFWPALFFIEGDGPEAAEYSRLKGEFEALQKAAVEKRCEIEVQNAVTSEPPSQSRPPQKQRVHGNDPGIH